MFDYFMNAIFFVYQKLLKFFGLRKIWTFENGVKVYKDQLLWSQIKRYQQTNLHEPQEEKHFVKIMQEYEGDGVFLDVGAASGYYSILAKLIKPNIKLYAFNPGETFVKMMEENLKLNGVSEKVEIVKKAISNYEGTCGLNRGWGGRITEQGDISVTTLDRFLQKSKLKVYLAKMDIQGEELNALKGAKQTILAIEHFIIGTHSSAIHDSCVSLLKNNGHAINFESAQVAGQPDGIIVSSRRTKL